jgi:hypothetical protein
MQISKHSVAREWLIFLAVLPLGFATCFLLGYYAEERFYGPYDKFWNDGFGLDSDWSLLWLVPYLAVTLWRLTWWSINAVLPTRSLKRSVIAVTASIAVLVLVVVYWRGVQEWHRLREPSHGVVH